MTDPINHANGNLGGVTLPIHFGDVVEITERDGSKTHWKLDLVKGEPILVPANVPTVPGLYYADGHSDMLKYRQLVLNVHGQWFWLDVTGWGRDAALVPASVPEISGYEITAAYIPTRAEQQKAGL